MELTEGFILKAEQEDFFNKNPDVLKYLQKDSKIPFISDGKRLTSGFSDFSRIVAQTNTFVKKKYGSNYIVPWQKLNNHILALFIVYYKNNIPFDNNNKARYYREASTTGLLETGGFIDSVKDYASGIFRLENDCNYIFDVLRENAGDPNISIFFNVKYKIGENKNITEPIYIPPRKNDTDDKKLDSTVFYILGAAGLIGGIIYLKKRKGNKGKRRK